MIITCPSCSTRYKLDPAQFGPEGRRVRCTKCAHVWTQMPADDMPKALTPDPAPVSGDMSAGASSGGGVSLAAMDEAMTARAETRRRAAAQLQVAGARRGGRAGWLVLALVVVSLVVAGILAREAVVRAWPPAERLYALAGIEAVTPGAGLKLKVTDHRQDVDGKTTILIIKGEVTNVADGVRDVPRLKAVLRASNGREITSWNFATAQARLLPGETVPFVTRLDNPPQEEKMTLTVIFIAAGR